MADREGVPDQQHPNLHLSPEERRLFGQLFSAADTEKIGVVTGEVAVKFFEKTRLSPAVLGEIWQIADSENRGLLTPAGFGIVLRLIGYAQAGRQVSAELALKPGGPLPKFEGIAGPSGPPPSTIPGTLQPQASGGPIRVPPLTPDKVNQYSSLFEESGAQNGLLSGETAKQIFERAQLPNEVLGRIWNLADTEQKGQLGLTEFIIAMHLLASFKSGSLRALPQILPLGLYEAAARRGVPRQFNGSRPTSAAGVASAIPRQFSGSGSQRTSAAPSRSPYGQYQVPVSPTASDQWAINAQEKMQFDQVFATVDTSNRGFVTGEQAVGFFSNSRLPEDALAQIWDLADINSKGQLNRDEFAVAMYLIRQQRGNKDGRDVLPQALPPNLIPPSMRRQPIAPAQPTAPVIDNTANITAPKSASEDLFGLDAFTAPISPKTIGGPALNNSSSPASERSPLLNQQTQPPQQSSIFKPFVPSSSFGQNMMTPQITGTSSNANPVQGRSFPPKQPSITDDLLGDNDPEISRRLTQETSELANLSNQVSTLTGQMQEVKSNRASSDQDLSHAQSQKRDFENRLSQLRSAYEQEATEVKALGERLSASRNETRKLQQEMAVIEGTLQDLQNQHRQVVGALDADQKENAGLKDSIRQTNIAIGELKPQLEKMRSDARQQKGLVAINKKQLATNEGELERVRVDLDGASAEFDETTRELEESKRNTDTQPLTRSPPAIVNSDASSTSMNPFHRRPRAESSDMVGASPYSPQAIVSPNHTAFDSFFGRSVTTSAEPSGAPPTSFQAESPSLTREIPQPTAPYGRSERSSDGLDVLTPSDSPPPSTYSATPRAAGEPPAPPQSRQITSSFLPFQKNLDGSDSRSSSVNVIPPASRMGGNSGFQTPTDRALSYSEPQSLESVDHLSRTFDTKPSETILNGSAMQSTRIDHSISDSPIRHQEVSVINAAALDSGQLSASRDIPGSFPGDETPPVQSKPTVSESSTDTFHSGSARGMPLSDQNESFVMVGERPRSPLSAKDDFDSAFAGFGETSTAPTRGTGDASAGGSGIGESPKAHGEFPPIQEFGADEDSESDSDHGFDDDFTAASPPQVRRPIEQASIPQPTTVDFGGGGSNLAPARPRSETENSPLPSPGAQSSPPTYESTVPTSPIGHRKDSNQFPAEYSGLLPSRKDQTLSPTSPPVPNAASDNSSSPSMGQRAMNLFGGANTADPASIEPTSSSVRSPMAPGTSAAPYAYGSEPLHQNQSQPTVPAKTAIDDDFDNEFGDLSEAREADDKVDEEFGSSRGKEGFDEFNPVFDSPMSSRTTIHPSSSTFSNDTTFRDFESSLSNSAQMSKSTEQLAPTNSHDFDAIFAGLDTPQNNGVLSTSTLSPQNKGFQPILPPRDQNFEPVPKQSAIAAASSSAGAASSMPALARGLSMGTEHDDPILKRLTGMGYAREESLIALEKFDYNIDKAADYLTSKP